MAILKGPLQFTGSVGNLTASVDKKTGRVILSEKKASNKKGFKNCDNLPRVKENNNEFAGLNIWTKLIRSGIDELIHLKKGRHNGNLVSIGKRIQLMGQNGLRGFRNITTSKFNYPLIGYNWNDEHPFDIACDVKPEVSITDDRRVVTISMNHFRSFQKFKWTEYVRYYRVYLSIFELPDVEWNEDFNQYFPVYFNTTFGEALSVSDWMSVDPIPFDFQISAAFDENKLPREKTTVLVSMGFEFASDMQHGSPYIVQGNGTAKIVGCF
jgi:hypothetical protein